MKLLKVASLSAACAVVLTACGGGGGSPGETHSPYQITLLAERVELPLNLDNNGPGIGVMAPYTTVLYVQATDGGNPIPGGEDIFGCNTAYGLSSGPLYYLDGKDEHSTDVTQPDGSVVKVPNAYRSITLPSNAGGASFHFHALDQAGTATITCSVQDPRDKKNVSASINITVGAATGKAASILVLQTDPNLGTQGNTNNIATSTAINARVRDDANQPVNGATMQVEIVGGTASAGARLLSGAQSGSVIRIGTTAGVGLFSVSSGSSEGAILLRMTTDRADGDVANGIQDPITQLFPVTVSNQVASNNLVISNAALPDAPYGLAYATLLSATGGMPPYQWSVLGGLPTGLSLSSNGLISGTPNGAMGGTSNFVVRVTDSQGKTTPANMSITVGDPPPPPPAPTPVAPALAVGGCTGTTCTVPAAREGTAYSYTFWTTGGDTAGTNAWSKVGAAWLAGLNINPTTGELTWAAPTCAAGPQTVQMRVSDGTTALIQTITVPVTQAGGAACP